MSKRFYPTAQSGELVLPPMLQESRRLYLISIDGRSLVEDLKLWRPQKSHQQVKALFGLAMKMLKTTFDDNGWDTSVLFRLPKPTGIAVTVDLFKLYFYSVCPMFNDHGVPITLSDEDCTTDRAAKFFSDIQAWAASQWTIYIADPNPNWKEKE